MARVPALDRFSTSAQLGVIAGLIPAITPATRDAAGPEDALEPAVTHRASRPQQSLSAAKLPMVPVPDMFAKFAKFAKFNTFDLFRPNSLVGLRAISGTRSAWER